MQTERSILIGQNAVLTKAEKMEHLPWYVYTVFCATVLLALWLFSKATGYAKSFLVLITVWILLQSVLGIAGFYSHTNVMTARFPLLVIPPVIFLASRFFTVKGKAFIDGLDIRTLTIFHIIRIFVEAVLFWLYIDKAIPQAMTFEGRNFDILSGLSAPFIYYYGFVKKKLSKTAMIVWNVVCMLLLLNVVGGAILSLPDRYQKFGFEQPNTAVGSFPFLLLPAVLVPLALFSNAAAIRQLLSKKDIAV